MIEGQGCVQARDLIGREINDETELFDDVATNDKVVGALLLVFEYDEFGILEPDVGAELRASQFFEDDVFLVMVRTCG